VRARRSRSPWRCRSRSAAGHAGLGVPTSSPGPRSAGRPRRCGTVARLAEHLQRASASSPASGSHRRRQVASRRRGPTRPRSWCSLGHAEAVGEKTSIIVRPDGDADLDDGGRHQARSSPRRKRPSPSRARPRRRPWSRPTFVPGEHDAQLLGGAEASATLDLPSFRGGAFPPPSTGEARRASPSARSARATSSFSSMRGQTTKPGGPR